MPSYEDLRSYFEESSQFQEAARAVSEIPIVMGFTLDVNPLWAFLYDFENDLVRRPDEFGWNIDDFLEYVTHRERSRRFGFCSPFADLLARRFQGYRRRNLSKPVKSWNALASYFGEKGRSPVTMTIVHRPLRPPFPDTPEDASDQAQLQRLVRAVAGIGASVRIEERPIARLALAAGDSIQAGTKGSGTLGGILEDVSHAKLYGMTCAHVAGRTDTIKDASGIVIGKCIADTTRVSLPAAKVCDPVVLATPNPIPSNGPDLNMLDCALIELSSQATRLKLGQVATGLGPGQNVTLQGAKTGKSQHKLGSLCLSYCFKSGQDYCFRDSIELLPQPWGPFGGPIGQMMSTLPTQGDSGAWVLTSDQPPDWAGVFFGEDGQRGFLIRSSWAHAWAEKVAGSTLTLF